jgi:hypothetical protein
MVQMMFLNVNLGLEIGKSGLEQFMATRAHYELSLAQMPRNLVDPLAAWADKQDCSKTLTI